MIDLSGRKKKKEGVERYDVEVATEFGIPFECNGERDGAMMMVVGIVLV